MAVYIALAAALLGVFFLGVVVGCCLLAVEIDRLTEENNRLRRLLCGFFQLHQCEQEAQMQILYEMGRVGTMPTYAPPEE